LPIGLVQQVIGQVAACKASYPSDERAQRSLRDGHL
jgi:hypothetical protein